MRSVIYPTVPCGGHDRFVTQGVLTKALKEMPVKLEAPVVTHTVIEVEVQVQKRKSADFLGTLAPAVTPSPTPLPSITPTPQLAELPDPAAETVSDMLSAFTDKVTCCCLGWGCYFEHWIPFFILFCGCRRTLTSNKSNPC